MDQFKSYVICTSPRSGSTLLCKLLRQTGVAGHPESHFHEPHLRKWFDYYGLNPENYANPNDALAAVFAAAYVVGKDDTDVFGLRLQQHSCGFLMQQLGFLRPELQSEKLRFDAVFGNTLFVHLSRENKLEQAISYVKAQQSGLWHMAPDGTELERLSAPMAPSYDAQAIAKQLARFIAMDKAWERWFLSARIKPLRLTYGALSTDPNGAVAQILGPLGLDSALVGKNVLPLAKLADATNKDWLERFLSENP